VRHPTKLRVLLALTVVVLVAAALSITLAAPLKVTGHGSPPCGGIRVLDTSTGRLLSCNFDDEFDGTALDPNHWSVVRSAQQGFHAGAECYVDDGKHVSVGNGLLTLTVTRTNGPYDCNGRLTHYLSGMVSSSGHFAQRYGVISIHAELPAAAGLQPALWMYPQVQSYGAWPNSGEIDIAELFGSDPNGVAAHLHFRPLYGTVNGVGQTCPVTDPGGSFHTYSVSWTPQDITFSYDGTLCAQFTSWQPAPPLNQPAPFDHPFYLLLEMALGSTAGNLPSVGTPMPSSLRIDWVRVWGQSGGNSDDR
jgi:beta-glucanase (GH16 family)